MAALLASRMEMAARRAKLGKGRLLTERGLARNSVR
jgi:hypothetical protein